jgi:hypothetical protein
MNQEIGGRTMIADTREELIWAACQHVRSQPHFRGIDVELDFEQVDDVLIVRGQVPTFFLKQVLQRALADLDGIGRVENCVEVTYCRHAQPPGRGKEKTRPRN